MQIAIMKWLNSREISEFSAYGSQQVHQLLRKVRLKQSLLLLECIHFSVKLLTLLTTPIKLVTFRQSPQAIGKFCISAQLLLEYRLSSLSCIRFSTASFLSKVQLQREWQLLRKWKEWVFSAMTKPVQNHKPKLTSNSVRTKIQTQHQMKLQNRMKLNFKRTNLATL